MKRYEVRIERVRGIRDGAPPPDREYVEVTDMQTNLVIARAELWSDDVPAFLAVVFR